MTCPARIGPRYSCNAYQTDSRRSRRPGAGVRTDGKPRANNRLVGEPVGVQVPLRHHSKLTGRSAKPQGALLFRTVLTGTRTRARRRRNREEKGDLVEPVRRASRREGEGENAGASSGESPLRHRGTSQRDFGFTPKSLSSSLKRLEWLISGSRRRILATCCCIKAESGVSGATLVGKLGRWGAMARR